MNNKSSQYIKLRSRKEKKLFLRKKDKNNLQKNKKLRRSKGLIR